jgi:hypothetical protein
MADKAEPKLPRTRRGSGSALIGGFLGLLIGGVVGFVIPEPPTSTFTIYPPRVIQTGVFAAGGFVFGTLIGGVVGLARKQGAAEKDEPEEPGTP